MRDKLRSPASLSPGKENATLAGQVTELRAATPEDTPALRHWLGSQDVIGDKTTCQIAHAIHALMRLAAVPPPGKEHVSAPGYARYRGVIGDIRKLTSTHVEGTLHRNGRPFRWRRETVELLEFGSFNLGNANYSPNGKPWVAASLSLGKEQT